MRTSSSDVLCELPKGKGDRVIEALRVFIAFSQLGPGLLGINQRKRHSSSADGPHYLGVAEAFKFAQLISKKVDTVKFRASLKNWYFRQITWNYFANPEKLSLCEEDDIRKTRRSRWTARNGNKFIDFRASLPTKRWGEYTVEYYSPSISSKAQVRTLIFLIRVYYNISDIYQFVVGKDSSSHPLNV